MFRCLCRYHYVYNCYVIVAYSLSHVWPSYNPMDCSPPGSSVHGISQERILAWVAISFSRGFFWPRDQTHISCIGRQILYHWASREAWWRRKWQPTPVFLPGESHGRRSLVGCSPWGHEESDTTEWHHFHFSLSCIGEGNGNPLQCSCLENPRDGGAWWAAVYGVAHSLTRLTWLSSSSSSGWFFILEPK